MIQTAELAFLFALGLVGAAALPSMGPLRLAPRQKSRLFLGVSAAARVCVYVGLGALAGGIGEAISLLGPGATRLLAAACGAAVLLLAFVLWRGLGDPVDRLRGRLWDRFMRHGVAGTHRLAGESAAFPRVFGEAFTALMLGGMEGLLPSSLTAALLAVAASTAGADLGAEALLAFGVGTLPLTLARAYGRGPSARAETVLRRAAAVLVAVAALYLFRRASGF